MQFVNTIWLWGLTALVIPIAIHLLSRKAGKIIKFGSIRHIEDTNTKQFKSIRLNELLLLLLRCALLTCIVLYLAGLQLDVGAKKKNWLLIESGLEEDNNFALLFDSLKKNGFETRLLSAGFPMVGNAPPAPETDYWSLLQQIDPALVDQVVVVSYSYLKRFKGERIELPDHVRWLTREPDSIQYALNSVQLPEGAVAIRYGKSSADKYHFVLRNDLSGQSGVLNQNSDTLLVTVVYDRSFEYDKNIMIAALRAVDNRSTYTLAVESVPIEQYAGKNSDWVIWMSEKTVRGTGRNLIVTRKSESNTKDLFIQIKDRKAGTTWQLTRRLNEGVALSENLAVHLSLLLSADDKATSRIAQFDRRVLPEQIRWSKGSSLKVQPNVHVHSGEKFLALVVVALLMMERLVAFKTNQ